MKIAYINGSIQCSEILKSFVKKIKGSTDGHCRDTWGIIGKYPSIFEIKMTNYLQGTIKKTVPITIRGATK